MDFKEKQVKSEQIYNGKVVKLYVDDVLCPNNNVSKREIVKHNGGVCVLAIVDNKVIMDNSDVIFLSVKPQVLPEVIADPLW